MKDNLRKSTADLKGDSKENPDNLELKIKEKTAELQTSNEELQTITEELQRANEELRSQKNNLLKVNQALRESQEKFSKAFHNNPAAMTLSDEEGRYIDVNESYSKLTGFSRE